CSTLSCTHTTSLAADTLSLHDALPISALGDQISKLPDDFRIENCVAIFGIKNGKWHTPASLPRDHPVRTRFDRAGDAVFTPRGKDRKSTRLNSSHDQISYAVFCLKKKT